MNTTPCEPDMTWLVEALTQAFGIRTDIPFEAWIEKGERIHCKACIAREIKRMLESPDGQLAPTLLGYCMRYIEARLVEPE